MRELRRYQAYSRKEAHDIFAPHTPFTPQAGTWGLQGIIPISDRPGDFVFFVTFGQQQGTHVFEEGITEGGVLSWQSQPKQSLRDPQIQQLIDHDELKNSIYLFLRTRKNTDYTYLGRLKYLSHDSEREYPVWFHWQVLDWELPPDVRAHMGLVLQPASATEHQPLLTQQGLIEAPPPAPRRPHGITTTTVRSRTVADYAAADARNRALGLAGERLVIEHEKQVLREHGRPDLADRVRHVAAIEGDGAGYDIESYTLTGEVKYIEVKTTRGPQGTAFYMSSNEVAFAAQHPGSYCLYRVYDFDEVTQSARFFVCSGNLERVLRFTPVQYRVSALL